MEELFRFYGFKELRLFIYTKTVYTNSTMENADIRTWLQNKPLLERFQWKNTYSEECARLMTLDHLVYFAFFSPRLKELTIVLSLMDLGKQLKSSMVECQTALSAGTIPFPSLRWLTLLIHDLDPSNLRAGAHLLVALIPESAILNVYIRPSELSVLYKYNGRPSKEYLAERGAMESQLPLIIKEIREKISAGSQKGRS